MIRSAFRALLAAAARYRARRADRRARRVCVVCGEPSEGRWECSDCAYDRMSW